MNIKTKLLLIIESGGSMNLQNINNLISSHENCFLLFTLMLGALNRTNTFSHKNGLSH